MFSYQACALKTLTPFWLFRANEKVGFKIPTTRYRKNSILWGALHIGTAKWTSDEGWSFRASRVARGLKGSGTGLTFGPLRILSDLITKQKNSE